MSLQIACDGCHQTLREYPASQVAITGSRTDGLGGGGLPNDDFHWCHSCARVAFAAVEAANVEDTA